MDAAEMRGHARPMAFPSAGLGRPHHRNAARPTLDARTVAAYQHATDEHRPQRPTWRCAGCAEPWPCPTARAHLVRVVDPVQLAMIMATRLTEAAGDLPGTQPGDLWDRFVAWTRRGPVVHRRERPRSTRNPGERIEGAFRASAGTERRPAVARRVGWLSRSVRLTETDR